MDERRRKRELHVINRRFSVGMTLSVAGVVLAIVGLALVRADAVSRSWLYAFLVIGVLGAVTAMMMTIARSKAGDDVDEADL